MQVCGGVNLDVGSYVTHFHKMLLHADNFTEPPRNSYQETVVIY